jgi:hypothetical protein
MTKSAVPPVERASNQTVAQIGDLVIKGLILSIDEGSAAKCVAIGFRRCFPVQSSGESLFLRKLLWASLPNKRQKLRDR